MRGFDNEARRTDLEPEQMRPEPYRCDSHRHFEQDHDTPAEWAHGYGPEALLALCTPCLLVEIFEHEQVVRTWHHHVRKLGR